jgi:ABC-type protease/lipase transport system fused ATPase/permease subunit
VTHRTTLLAHIDKLLVLDGGRVRHFGPVAEVLHAMKQGSAQVVPLTRHAGAMEQAR